MAGLFYKLGRLAGPHVRKGQWFWRSLTGDEADAIEAEHAVGRDLAEAMRAQMGGAAGGAAADVVREIGGALAECVANKKRKFDFTVVGADEPNAFALPGGFIFVTTPLLSLMKADRAELAFVLGHEMAHVIKLHPMQRLISDTTISTAIRATPMRGWAGGWVKSAGAKMLQSAYSQDRELMADRLGARLAQAAGFDPAASMRMLGRLRDLAKPPVEMPLAEYFSSHPPFDLRIGELDKYLGARK